MPADRAMPADSRLPGMPVYSLQGKAGDAEFPVRHANGVQLLG